MAEDDKYVVLDDKSSTLKLLVKSDTDFAKQLEQHGNTNFPLIDWCKQYVSKDRCFVDVGAHVGTYSLHLAPHCLRVYAFEPQRGPHNALCGGIVLNSGRLGKVFAYNMALGRPDEHNQRKEIYIPSAGGLDATVRKPADSLAKSVSVEKPFVYALDSLNLNNIGFIKIYTNGSELDVLKGSEKTILDSKPKILIKCLDKDHAAIKEYLSTLKYNILGVTGCPQLYLASAME